MQRIVCPERDDWRATAESAGFDFHTIDGERYWDERAYYAFTLDEIERGIEEPTAEMDAMCVELVGDAIDDEEYLRRLRIPEAFWPLISESWHRDDASLYGRLDLSFDGRGPAKLLEYNADTPTSIFEAAVFQWTWLEQTIERRIIPAHADQFNSIHERLIEAWRKLSGGRFLHLAGTTESDEDAGTLGSSFVRKPLYSREGANVALVSDGVIVVEQEGPYGAEGFIRQALAPLPNFSGQYPVVGSWLVDHAPCGLSIREDENP